MSHTMDYKAPLNFDQQSTMTTATLPSYAAANTPQYTQPMGQQPGYIQPSGPLMFHCYDVSGVFSRPSLNITFSDKTTIAFSVKMHSAWSSSPDIEFHKGGPEGPLIATASFHALSQTVDLSLTSGGRSVATKLKSDGAFSRRHVVELEGQTLYWKGHSEGNFAGGNLKLVDSSNRVLAYYHRKTSMSKWGSIEIVAQGLSDSMVEGIVVSCIAMAEKERRRRKANNGSAAVEDIERIPPTGILSGAANMTEEQKFQLIAYM